jgi:hypothetical protein
MQKQLLHDDDYDDAIRHLVMDRKEASSSSSTTTTMIDDQHPLLQSLPNFAKALKDFDTFLTATLEDLQTKTKVLTHQKSKTSRNIKNYLSLQIYLLQKHLRRLDEFQSEIHSRVTCIFNRELTQTEADQQFLKLLADMSKMKTRCKHILDVTDRHCVLQESSNCASDQEDQHQAHEDSLDSTSESTNSSDNRSSPKLQGNVIKTTVTSVSSHLAVIAKTYTKRHSSSQLLSTNAEAATTR